MRGLRMFQGNCRNLLHGKEGINGQITKGIFVADVEPKLVKMIRAGFERIQPDIPPLRFPELASVRLFGQGGRQGPGLATGHSTNQLGTGGNIPPLVRATYLNQTVVVLVKVYKVIPLHQLVTKLHEGHSVLQSQLDRILGKHIIDGHMLAHIGNEIQETPGPEPIVVVDHQCRGGPAGIKIQKLP